MVGAGPAGLSCAYQLARRGYPVTVFEAFSQPGGMLRYGIPRYRLPRPVLDGEIQRILDLGVELKCNTAIGREVPLETLRREYKAVFVGIGAHRGIRLRIPGEDAAGVLTGTEFLNRVNSGEEVQVGRKVIVIGGGDTAIDSARVSRRLGAEVTILYRRSRSEMPAIEPEIDGALEEGVKIEFLAAPVEILVKDGVATGMRAIRMDLGAPDASGRPRPVPRPGSEFDLEADLIIAAISQQPASDGLDARPRRQAQWIQAPKPRRCPGWTASSPVAMRFELGLVTIAIAQGRFAAEAIDAWIQGKPLEHLPLPPLHRPGAREARLVQAGRASRARSTCRASAEPDTEIELGLSRRRGARRSQTLHVVRHVHGLRNLLDVLHQQLLREAAQGRALQSQAGAVQRLQEMRRCLPLRLYRNELADLEILTVPVLKSTAGNTTSMKTVSCRNRESGTRTWRPISPPPKAWTELTENHWKVINYLRNYYLQFGIAPMIRKVCKETGFKLNEIYQMFPSGPAKGACKLAGLPKPTGCV